MGLFDFFKKKPTIPQEALTFWVHRRSQLEGLQQQLGDKGAELKVFPLGEVFAGLLALSTSEGPIPVRKPHLEGLGLSFEEAFRVATNNVSRLLAQPVTTGDLFLWSGLGVEALAFFAPTLVKHLSLEGAPVVMVPMEGFALLADSENVDGLRQLLDVAEEKHDGSAEFRSLRAITWRSLSELPVEWLPPPEHPLHGRFVRLAAKTRRLEAQGLHHQHAAEAAPLAHLASTEQGLIGSWVRDADVVMPRVDRVVLFETADQPLARLEVPFATLLEVLPQAFEPLSTGEAEPQLESAKLVRVRSALFPSADQRRFLLQRAAFDAQHLGLEDRDVPGAELLAAWDAGEAILANADPIEPGRVLLEAADRRGAAVTVKEFGDRISRRDPHDQMMFYQSFLLTSLLHASLSEEGVEFDLEGLPMAPEGLAERLGEGRPSLMSSNQLRAMREAVAEDPDDDVGRKMMELAFDTWEPAQLFPAVRPPGYAEGTAANTQGMVSGALPGQFEAVIDTGRVTRSAVEGLSLELVSDRGDRMMTLNATMLTPELTEAAWRSMELNLEAASLQPFVREAEGRYLGPWHDGYDFARVLLLPKLLSRCEVKGAPWVLAPTVARVWVTGSDDVAGLTAVLDAIDAHFASGAATSPYEYRELLFGWPWTVKDGVLVRATVAADHPLAARLTALDAQLEKRRATSRQNVGSFAHAVSAPTAPRGETSA